MRERRSSKAKNAVSVLAANLRANRYTDAMTQIAVTVLDHALALTDEDTGTSVIRLVSTVHDDSGVPVRPTSTVRRWISPPAR